MSITATNDIENIKGKVTELENCMDKAATRIADLKTSEQEGRFKEVEGTIRLHNIKHAIADPKYKKFYEPKIYKGNHPKLTTNPSFIITFLLME